MQSFVVVHAGEFMLARYREVVTTVLTYRDAKDKLVRRAAIALLVRPSTWDFHKSTS